MTTLAAGEEAESTIENDVATPFAYSPVSSISATKVLGDYDYFLGYSTGELEHSDTADQLESAEPSRVKVVYAPNGSGKTNFLRAAYHLLTPDVDSLQALVEIPMESLRVSFESGASIALTRKGWSPGGYSVKIEGDSWAATVDSASDHLDVDPADFGPLRYRRLLTTRSDYQTYLERLARLSSNVVFVGDDRSVQSGIPEFEQQSPGAEAARDFDRRQPRSLMISTARTKEVQDSLARVEKIFSRLAFAGISTGSRDGAYAEITRNVLGGASKKWLAKEAKADLTKKIRYILLKGRSFETYGLINLRQVRGIATQVTRARENDRNFKHLHGVLDPYLSNLSEQMDTLSDAQKVIHTYVTSVNGFLEKKALNFHTIEGITLINRAKVPIEPSGLSSGEKHLLLLLSSAVIARGIGCLFIIDEPELSLGLEWQRTLMRELLRCTDGSPVQFLVASHSVQIMNDIDELDIVTPTDRGLGG